MIISFLSNLILGHDLGIILENEIILKEHSSPSIKW